MARRLRGRDTSTGRAPHSPQARRRRLSAVDSDLVGVPNIASTTRASGSMGLRSRSPESATLSALFPSRALRARGAGAWSRRRGVLQVVGLAQPVGERRLHFVAVRIWTMCATFDFDLRSARRICGARTVAAEEDAHLEKAPLRPHEEVAGLAREHDRVVRRVDALLAEAPPRSRAAAPTRRAGPRTDPAVSAASVVVQQSCALAFVDPLLAVVALVSGRHRAILVACIG